ncbi:MAG: dipeptide epimerase [Robiginitomaculum sp.]|nr:MAG: dipeptide epimerase [Robiginitomaculum sp.]
MSTNIQFQLERQSWPIAGQFRISRGSKTSAEVLVVSLRDDGGCIGRGECVPYARYGESLNSVSAQIEGLRSAIVAGMSRAELQSALPTGAARNAIDCAMWDLQSQHTGQPVWQLAALPGPTVLTTAFTLSLDQPNKMAEAAKAARQQPLLKLKLAGDGSDQERVLAITQVRPDARLILDGNEGFSFADLQTFLVQIAGLNIVAIEQPLPADEDEALAGFDAPFPLCADESLHSRAQLPQMAARYDMINIKLDKTGGLTEALALLAEAKALDFQIMAGCMVATSLSMAPALLIAAQADLVDLDGPLLLQRDRADGLRYQQANIPVQEMSVWGTPRTR